jgi:hypothetical protein
MLSFRPPPTSSGEYGREQKERESVTEKREKGSFKMRVKWVQNPYISPSNRFGSTGPDPGSEPNRPPSPILKPNTPSCCLNSNLKFLLTAYPLNTAAPPCLASYHFVSFFFMHFNFPCVYFISLHFIIFSFIRLDCICIVYLFVYTYFMLLIIYRIAFSLYIRLECK